MPEPNAADPTAVQDAASTQTPTPAPVATPSPQPDYKALYEELRLKQTTQTPGAAITAPAKPEENEWFKRSVGFQQAAQTATQKVAELEKELADARAKLTGFDTIVAEKETKLGELLPKAEELGRVQASLERVTIIASEFPDLLKFLGKDEDLLPVGSGDDLRAKLTSFQAKLNGTAAPAPKKTPEGATPTPPASSGDGTYASYMQEAMNALSRGDLTAYDQSYAKALSATK